MKAVRPVVPPCVLRISGEQLLWYAPGQGAVAVTDATRGQLLATLAAPGTRATLAVPGDRVRLLPLRIQPEEKRHLSRSLPFLLEEEVAEDIEELHFAAMPVDGLDYVVMVCRRQLMAAWGAEVAFLPEIRDWLPEGLLLPWRPAEWVLVIEGDRMLLRWGPHAATTLAPALLGTFLDSLLREQELPERLVVYGAQPPGPRSLPEALLQRMDFRCGGFADALRLAEPELLPSLRQGEFAPRLPLARWWREWRLAAALAGAAVLLQLLAAGGEYFSLKEDNLALRSAVQARYRDAFPRGAVVDAERQLRRQLELLRGDTVAGGFTRIMAQLGRVMAAESGSRLSSVNYSERSGELRIGLTAADFSAVERLRAGLEAQGLVAVLENSTSSGEGVRARLRLESG